MNGPLTLVQLMLLSAHTRFGPPDRALKTKRLDEQARLAAREELLRAAIRQFGRQH